MKKYATGGNADAPAIDLYADLMADVGHLLSHDPDPVPWMNDNIISDDDTLAVIEGGCLFCSFFAGGHDLHCPWGRLKRTYERIRANTS